MTSGLTDDDYARIRLAAQQDFKPAVLLKGEDAESARDYPRRRVVAPETCQEWRERVRDGSNPRRIVETSEWSLSSVHDHVAGRCDHDVDAPALIHRNGRWVEQWGRQ